MIQFSVVAAAIASACLLVLHLRYDTAIRRLLTHFLDNDANRKTVVAQYHRLDRLRIAAGVGVIVLALGALMAVGPEWSDAVLDAAKILALAVFIITSLTVLRYNFHRDYR